MTSGPGETSSFETFVYQYKDKLFAYFIAERIPPPDAEELLNDTLKDLYFAWCKEIPTNPPAFAFTIAKRRKYDWFREQKKQPPEDDGFENLELSEEGRLQPDTTFERREEIMHLFEVAGLSEPQKQAILYHHFLGFSLREVADIEGCGIDRIKRRLYLGKQKIRTYFSSVQGGTNETLK